MKIKFFAALMQIQIVILLLALTVAALVAAIFPPAAKAVGNRIGRFFLPKQ